MKKLVEFIKSPVGIALSIVLVIGIALIIYFAVRKKNVEPENAAGIGPMPGPGNSIVLPNVVDALEFYKTLPKGSFPLKKSTNPQANKLTFLLQYASNSLNDTKLMLDGKFGSKTEAAAIELIGKPELTESDAMTIYGKLAGKADDLGNKLIANLN